MKKNRSKLLACIALPLAVGGLAAFLSGSGMKAFESVAKPPLSPPGWLFTVVWTVLYILMGIASFRVLSSGKGTGQVRRALIVYAFQLAANFIWPILFFRFSRYLAALIWLLVLWILVFVTASRFSDIDRRSGDLMLPYLLWTTFALYLNYGIFKLN